MTNEEFKVQIEQWQNIVTEAGITMPNGAQIPDKLYCVILGVSYSTLKKMAGTNSSNRTIQPYIEKMIKYINMLKKSDFLKEIRLAIPEYLENLKNIK